MVMSAMTLAPITPLLIAVASLLTITLLLTVAMILLTITEVLLSISTPIAFTARSLRSTMATLLSPAARTLPAARTTMPRLGPGARIILGRRPELLRYSGLIHRRSQQLFDAAKLILLLFADKCISNPIGLRARGPADTMNVIFPIVRDIIVDNHLDIVDIDATRQDIRSYQDRQPLTPELQQHLFPSTLLQIAVNFFDIEFRAPQLCC